MIRRLLAFALLTAALLSAAPAVAQEDQPPADKIVVAEVNGPLDQRTIDYLVDAVQEAETQLVILQFDTPGIASGDPSPLFEALRTTVVPVAMWVGPAGAEAYGGVAGLQELVDVVGAAPGARIGFAIPTVAGGSTEIVTGTRDEEFDTAATEITEDGPNPGYLDVVSPSIGQFIAALDGRTIDGVTLETTETIIADDGTEVIVPSVFVEFRKPGLFTRFLRLSIFPEATFFFLAAGIALMAFEFYAAGAGITAAVSVLTLFLAGYGLATLPINWVAVVATLLGMWMYTWEFQRNQLGIRSIVGTALLLGGGFTFTTASPQFAPRWWAVILVVIGVALFYVFAMGTVVRSRFSTPTLGREHLVGARGVAETDFDPEGFVTIAGARWKARSHRAAGLQPGDEIEVVEVKGIVLEVGPPAAPPPSSQ
ncbi:MAG: NfeD family protein [Acidimicrobiia bacterium]|nr:NfeD family protein [Acidimicrobiia bacterium]